MIYQRESTPLLLKERHHLRELLEGDGRYTYDYRNNCFFYTLLNDRGEEYVMRVYLAISQDNLNLNLLDREAMHDIIEEHETARAEALARREQRKKEKEQ